MVYKMRITEANGKQRHYAAERVNAAILGLFSHCGTSYASASGLSS